MSEKNLPRGIMRDCSLWANRESLLGQIGDITPPVLTQKREDMRNAGMPRPRKVALGYEATEFSFKMPGLIVPVLKLFGVAPGVEHPFLITGAFVDEDGTVHSGVLSVRGRLGTADHGTWQPGELSENNYTVDCNYYKLEVDGEEIYEVSDFDVRVGGVSQYAGIRSALLLD